jgi:hypothetical protein
MNPEEIVASIEQAYQKALLDIQNLDAEKRAIIAGYIKELEQKKITEIKQALHALSVNHQ